MRRLMLIFLFVTVSANLRAETFQADTIDNWQIYNGSQLILAGHQHIDGMTLHAAIKRTELGEIGIEFRHCANYPGHYTITFEVIDRTSSRIKIKKFSGEIGRRLNVRQKELELGSSTLIVIHYTENVANGVTRVLGQIEVR